MILDYNILHWGKRKAISLNFGRNSIYGCDVLITHGSNVFCVYWLCAQLYLIREGHEKKVIGAELAG